MTIDIAARARALTKSRGRALAAGLLLCLTAPALTAQTPSAGGIDPFYERLLQDGTLALSTGDLDGAIRQLELGCFGMLEAPQRLADCLVRLATARADTDDRKGFLDTLSRVLEVERRFGGYSAAQIPPRYRRSFETRIEEWAPPASLAGLAAFASIADRQNAARIRQLPLDERRAQLDILIAQAPTKTLWRRLEVDLELSSGNYPRAAELVAQLTARGESLRCAGGRARAGLGSCDDAILADLERCGDDDPEAAERAAVALLTCHIERAERDAGEAVVARMEESQRDRSEVRRLIRKLRRVDRARETAPSPEAAPQSPGAAISEAPGNGGEALGDGSGAPQGDAEAASSPSQEERSRLERSRRALLEDQRSEFDALYRDVTTLAQRHAGWSEAQLLAAELAYRLSLWQQSVTYFERAEAAEPLAPDQEFYLAVALYKSGEQSAAEQRLERCLPRIRPSNFVQFWSARIRGDG